MTEADEYVEDVRDALGELGNAIESQDYEGLEDVAGTIEDRVNAVVNGYEATQQAFQRYDEAIRTEMEDWYDQLEGYVGDLEEGAEALDGAIDTLEGVSSRLEEYVEPDERTQELFDVTDRLADTVFGDDE